MQISNSLHIWPGPETRVLSFARESRNLWGDIYTDGRGFRYGKIFRGNKVHNCQERGAVGVILFSDPDDVAVRGRHSVLLCHLIFPHHHVSLKGERVTKNSHSDTEYLPRGQTPRTCTRTRSSCRGAASSGGRPTSARATRSPNSTPPSRTPTA